MTVKEVHTVGELSPAVFFNYALAGMQELIDALVDDAQVVHGSEFKRSDVKWLETTPDGSSQQRCQLMWRDLTLLEIQFSLPLMRWETKVRWTGRRQ